MAFEELLSTLASSYVEAGLELYQITPRHYILRSDVPFADFGHRGEENLLKIVILVADN